MAPHERWAGSGRRTPKGALMAAVSAGLIALAALAVSAAGPAAAGPPHGSGHGSTSTADAPKSPNPNADDDAIKDPCVDAIDHSEQNGGPSEQDQTDSCTPKPPAPQVAVVLPATIVEPVDLLPCGRTITADGVGRQPDVAVTRLNDADKTALNYCEPFAYDLSSIPGGVRFLKPTGYPLAQFFVDVTWYRNVNKVDEIATVDFEAVKGGFPVELSPCPTGLRDSTGEVVGAEGVTGDQLAALGIVDMDGLPSVWYPEDNGLTQFACVADADTEFDPWAPGGPQFVVKQTLYLLGDVIFRG